MKSALFNWSGGKDSSLSLYHVLDRKEYKIETLFTSINETFQRSSMHGVRVELIQEQARSIGLPLTPLMIPEPCTMEIYQERMKAALHKFTRENTVYSIFGDIFLEDLRRYREKQLAQVGMKAVFPIWQVPTDKLINEFIDLGFKAVIVCVNERHLNKSFVGRAIDRQFVKDLPKAVDPCGENGEYHSFVYDGPIFSRPVNFLRGDVVYRSYQAQRTVSSTAYDQSQEDISTGFWFCDLVPQQRDYYARV